MHEEKLILFCAVACCFYTVATAQDNCTVPTEPRFRGFSRSQVKNFPREDVDAALKMYPEIQEALALQGDLTGDDPQTGNDIAITDWKLPCPEKSKNLQFYGIKEKKKLCWVLPPLWIFECAKKTCDYTFRNKVYYQCRPTYTSIQFWAYCPLHDDGIGPFKLLLRYVPRYCDCRRYFCGAEEIPKIDTV